MTAPSPGALGRLGRETPLQQGGAPEQAGPLFEGGMREAALGPLSSPPAPSPQLLTHQCFSSSERAQAASRACAWGRGPRGPSGCFPGHPRPLKVQRRHGDQLPPRPDHSTSCSSAPPSLPKTEGPLGGGMSGCAGCEGLAAARHPTDPQSLHGVPHVRCPHRTARQSCGLVGRAGCPLWRLLPGCPGEG